jgi:hypothetical protein
VSRLTDVKEKLQRRAEKAEAEVERLQIVIDGLATEVERLRADLDGAPGFIGFRAAAKVWEQCAKQAEAEVARVLDEVNAALAAAQDVSPEPGVPTELERAEAALEYAQDRMRRVKEGK